MYPNANNDHLIGISLEIIAFCCFHKRKKGSFNKYMYGNIKCGSRAHTRVVRLVPNICTREKQKCNETKRRKKKASRKE